MSYAYPMDSILSYDENGVPQYDRAINSAQLRTLYHELLSDGVLLNNSTNLQVVANSTMNLTVKAGLCNIQGCIKKFEEDIDVTIESASTSYNRIDTIVARLDLNSDYRDIGIFVIKGTPASVPTRPELTRDTNVYEIALADITISANATTLSQSNISDTRLDTNRCGIISCIAEFDTTKLYEQIQADLKEFQESNESEFEQWFDNMKGQLGDDAAGNLQLQIDDHTEKSVSSENGAHGFRYFEGYVEAHIYDEESRTLKWVRVPGSGIAYDGEKSVKAAINEVSRTLGYTKSYNLLPCNKVGGEWNGIKTTPVLNDDNSLAYYSVSGSRTSETYYNIYDSKNLSTVFPKGVEVGKTYKVSANSTNALIRIAIYEMINGAYQLSVNTNTEAEWTPNANTTRLEIRISVDSNASGLNDVRIYPMIRPNDIEDSTYMPYVEDVQSRLLTIKQKTMTVTTDANGNAHLGLPLSTHVINITSNSFLTSDMVGFIPCVANASWYVRLVKNYGSYAPKGSVTATITVTYLE